MGRADVERLASHSAPPIEWGKKPSPRCGYVREETERPGNDIIVVVVVVVVVVVGGPFLMALSALLGLRGGRVLYCLHFNGVAGRRGGSRLHVEPRREKRAYLTALAAPSPDFIRILNTFAPPNL